MAPPLELFVLVENYTVVLTIFLKWFGKEVLEIVQFKISSIVNELLTAKTPFKSRPYDGHFLYKICFPFKIAQIKKKCKLLLNKLNNFLCKLGMQIKI